MARKSKLETVFTGDDRPFARVVNKLKSRVDGLKKKMGGMKGAVAMLGGGMAIRSTLQQYDRVGKLATRFNVTAEALQRLGHVAQLGGSDMETVAKGMRQTNLAASEAKKGAKTYADEFAALGIDVDKFYALDHEDRWLAMSDAVANATDRNRAMAATQRIMGRAGAELFDIMEQGTEAQRAQMADVRVASTENVRNIERLNDAITTIKTGAFSVLADIIGGLVKAFIWVSRRIAREMAVIQSKFADLVKAAPALFPESMEKWAAGQKSAAEMRKGADAWIKFKEEEDRKALEAKAKGGGVGLERIDGGATTAKEKSLAAVAEQSRNLFDPRKGGGFFVQGARSGLSKHATKSLGQKMQDLAQKTFSENQTTNQLLRDALL